MQVVSVDLIMDLRTLRSHVLFYSCERAQRVEAACGAKRLVTSYYTTMGASTRRADARLGSAHARNDVGCRKIEAVHATVLPRGA